MSEIKIPLRPKDDSRFSAIKKIEKDCLVHNVLYGCRNEESFIRYFPEYAGVDGKSTPNSKKAAKQFFSYARHKEFQDSYRITLHEFLNSRVRNENNLSPTDSGGDEAIEPRLTSDSTDKRKDQALRSLLDQAMSLVEHNSALDPDSLKVVTDIFNKLGFLKTEESKIEAPRRYLPVRCISECQYRLFVESHIESGEIENECLRCKALAFAREKGFIYDPTRNLLPKPPEEQLPLIKVNNIAK
ncbi:MAG: hypothetical protein HDS14_00445 [Bacteroides sp.]|nr:hypothetical protein [Bacteroides sp.]